MEKLLTVTELAEALRVPKQTVYLWNSQGTGPAMTKVGRHCRYAPAAVRAWLATNTNA